MTRKQIEDKLGFTAERIHGFTKRYNEKQRKLVARIALKKKGRPPKNYVASE